MNDLLLMMKDIPVMRINTDTATYEVLDEKHLPFIMQGTIRPVPSFASVKTQYDDTQRQIAIHHNYDVLQRFLASRILPITRENAKKVYNALGLTQLQDDRSKVLVSLCCRALSLQDNYWVKMSDDSVPWDKVDLRKNHLSEAIAQVSLHGSSLTLRDRKSEMMHTPELTGQGAYAKAWFELDQGLCLLKRGANGVTEAKIEVMVSDLLDNCNVDHLHYFGSESNGEYVCACKCMTTDKISILSGIDFDAYCNHHGINSREEAIRIDAEAIYKMWIVDYLISNRDRHGMNWGFFYDCDSMEIIGCHPLYDHNNAFDIPLMQDDDATYLYDDSRTMKQAAEYAMSKVDFHFYREFVREDFLTQRQYDSFTRRAKQLGIKVIPKEPQPMAF